MKKLVLASCFLGLGQLAMASDNCVGRHSFDQEWPYRSQIGWSQFAAGVGAGIRLQGACDFLQAEANADANVVVFGSQFSIGQAHASAYWHDNNARGLTSRVTLLGFELDGFELHADEPIVFQTGSGFDFDEEGDVSFSIGPFSIPLRFGVAGASNYTLNANIDGLKVRADIVPNVEAHAYAQVGVKIPLVELAVRGSVLVLQDELAMRAGLAIAEDWDNLYLHYDASLHNRLHALDGHLTGYAKAKFFFTKEYERELFRWQGIELDDEIFAISDLTRL